MKIIIAGAGEVGTHLAKLLARENFDTILLDEDPAKLKDLEASYDLMTYTGSPTSIGALKEAGATEVYACATHAVFSEPAVDRLKESPFSEVIVTDSIELPEDKKFDKLTILSTSKMFAEIIKRIYSNEAISDLFELPYDEDDIL